MNFSITSCSEQARRLDEATRPSPSSTCSDRAFAAAPLCLRCGMREVHVVESDVKELKKGNKNTQTAVDSFVKFSQISSCKGVERNAKKDLKYVERNLKNDIKRFDRDIKKNINRVETNCNDDVTHDNLKVTVGSGSGIRHLGVGGQVGGGFGIGQVGSGGQVASGSGISQDESRTGTGQLGVGVRVGNGSRVNLVRVDSEVGRRVDKDRWETVIDIDKIRRDTQGKIGGQEKKVQAVAKEAKASKVTAGQAKKEAKEALKQAGEAKKESKKALKQAGEAKKESKVALDNAKKESKEALKQAGEAKKESKVALNDTRWMAQFLKGAASTIVESCGGSIDWDRAGHLGVGGQVASGSGIGQVGSRIGTGQLGVGGRAGSGSRVNLVRVDGEVGTRSGIAGIDLFRVNGEVEAAAGRPETVQSIGTDAGKSKANHDGEGRRTSRRP
ncbi:hypothetical protein HD553DRAFT_359507 [Filobasidium floriforme]|uniref:uncharacterized protein n=1 Tax=Filobasidium floriforme TaxID=5210 RepID=UPI001E8D9EA5|nr:uncharacterized protein HD553DRAFT_359507 [Filobasidium floriforme]KAH8081121.1 hypothetical protein HD553DRAFT_359507 [Filobasidium floriforme]